MTSIVVGKDRISLIESERYVAGTKNVYLMKVAFSEDWEGLEKKLVFRTDCFDMAVELISCSEQFPIPSEVFARPTNKLQVGAYGSKCGEQILNTRWLSLGRVVKGTFNHHDHCGCEPPSKPSPDTYKVLRELIDRKADRLTFEDGQFILWAGDDPLSSFDAPIALPDGGLKGQVLAKASDESGDYVWETVDSSLSLRLPVGSIQIWSGSIDNIPESFSLCDGQNGTPDLRGAMILGASDSIEPGTVIDSSLQDTPMPISLVPDEPAEPSKPGTGSELIEHDPQPTTRYYALAFIQKTSLTELDKKQGQSAYDIAVDTGFEGTEEEWLESLRGKDGENGKSAYDIAVEAGYTGTIEDFTKLVTDIITYEKPDDTVKDLVVTNIADLPTKDSGWYAFNNVQFTVSKSRMGSLTLSKNLVYIDLDTEGQMLLTTLDNHAYICTINEDGEITAIEEVASGSGNGLPGKDGADGKSAYELAIEAGFEGDLDAWLESLKGSDGQDGKSAYELAKAEGFEGTEAEWLESLKGERGADGKSAYEVAVEEGYTGTEVEWIESLTSPKAANVSYNDAVTELGAITVQQAISALNDKIKQGGGSGEGTGKDGVDGKSAYELAVLQGFEGTLDEWLESLKGQNGSDGAPGEKGEPGKDGKSAYDIAKEHGFDGTEEQWLESLKGMDGADGESAYQIAQKNGFIGTEQEWLESLKGKDGTTGTVTATNVVFSDQNANLGADNVQAAIDTLATKIENGEAGQDGKSAYDLAVEQGFKGTLDDWLNSLVGEPGTDGDPGESAYEVAVNNGFDGSEAEWLESLKGEKGDQGDKGDKGDPGENGQNGTDGEDGKSAYEIARDAGFTGTVEEWLASLKGEKGDKGESAYELAVTNGFSGDQAAWLASLKGPKGDPGTDGKSTYELAVENGYEGTEEEWLEIAKGPAGENGKSAYELAQEAGYEGTLGQWLDSLKGEGIAEFVTYADMTITSIESLTSITKPTSVHFERCKFAAADGNVLNLSNELVLVVPADTQIDIYQMNGDVTTITFGEDEVFSTLSVKSIELDGEAAYKAPLIVNFGLDNPPPAGALFYLAPDDFSRDDYATGDMVFGIVTVPVTEDSEDTYWVQGTIENAANNRVIFNKVIKLGSSGSSEPEDHFVTYKDIMLTSSEQLSKVTEPMNVRFMNTTISAADDNSISFTNELAYVTPGDGHYLINRLVGETIHIACDESGAFNTLHIDVIEDGRNGADGLSAYEVAVEQGFEGTKKEWLASLKGAAGKDAIALQKIDDYKNLLENPVIVGRWIDDKAVYRRLLRIDRAYTTFTVYPNSGSSLKYELQGYMPKMNHVIKIEGFVQFSLSDNTDILYQVPIPASHMHIVDGTKTIFEVSSQYVMSLSDDVPNYVQIVLMNVGDTVRTLANVKSHMIIDYVPSNAPVLSDDDIIIPDFIQSSGTSDHTELTNRDALDQHPVSAITGLSDKLSATPTKSITPEEIDGLFT